MACSIGIDAGSKTIKVVVLDESGNVLHSVYRRHRSDIRSTLAGALREISWRFEDVVGAVGVTGSAGIPIAASLDVPFVQEVVATTMAVERRHPQADAIVELGGEDAKLVYLTGGLEQRMNATCAGGTGGFIDTVAFMIGAKACDVSKLARSAKRIYPISSRCAVFAQTDIRPLLNEGAGKADIAASALEAVVRQTLGGLACGRPIDGTVVFLGGPIEHIPELTHRFRIALGLDHRSGIKPVDAHLYTAFGAAFYGEECVCRREGRGRIVSLRELEYRVAHSLSFGKPLARLPRLFSSDEEIDSFRGRHAACATPRVRLFDCEGPLYLGFDAGSTAVKLAVLDDAGRLAYFDCRSVGGDVLGTSMRMLEAFYAAMPRAANGNPYVSVARSAVCGYGEGMLKATLGLDEGVVETLAHVRAARELCPDLTFLLDIGGQDMKAIWVRNGRVVDAVLNEACSSGCGSFVEGTAYSLSSTPEEFAVGALLAPEPVDLGTKCTVFMTSRVRHAQKAGASVPDIAAGVAYSVVKNALFRIIGASKVGSLGERVVVQGGTFMSDAVLRAFELVSGIEVVRPERSFLMGAMGAALVAKDRARLSKDNEGGLRGGLVGEEALRGISLTRRGARCEKCGNECPLSIVDFGEGRVFVSGNRCDRAYEYLGYGPALSEGGAKRPPNVVALERKLLARHSDHIGDGPRARIRVGLMNTLNLYEHVPFWHTFFKELGFSIVVPNDERSESTGAAREGSATVPSESACHPAKLSHSRLTDLTKNGGAHAVFMPRYTRGRRCPVSCDYSAALFDGELGEKGEVRFLSPLFKNVNPMFLSQCGDRDALAACIDSLLEDEGLDSLGDDLLDRALSLSLRRKPGLKASCPKPTIGRLLGLECLEGAVQ